MEKTKKNDHAPEKAKKEAMPMATVRGAGAEVKESLVGAIGGVTEVETELMGFARTTVDQTLDVAGTVVHQGVRTAKALAAETIDALVGVGTLGASSAQKIASAVIQGASAVGGEAIGAAGLVAGTAIKEISVVGGELTKLTVKTVHGTLSVGQDLMMAATGTAKTVLVSGVEAVDEVGTAAIKAARGMLLGLVGGAKDVLSAALPAQKSA